MIMSKYDQFIEDLNKEVDNMNISNVSTYFLDQNLSQ